MISHTRAELILTGGREHHVIVIKYVSIIRRNCTVLIFARNFIYNIVSSAPCTMIERRFV